MRNRALGIYISIPFCRSKCTYCNFASGVYPASEHARYVDRVVQDLANAPQWAAEMQVELPRAVDSIYLGGGTPSLLEPGPFEQLFAALRAAFQVTPDAEITVECAPGQLAQPTLEAMAAAGVNRVSLGVQSFIDREAAETGRLHKRATVLDDLRRLRAAGISNLNVDLIAGLPGQTFASWNQSLDVLLDTGAPHASVYMLEVDEDSRLGREMLAGGARYHAELVPSDEAIAKMYETGLERLAAAGLEPYEISNFSRPAFQSLHNLRYWQRRPYLGLGLDASSMLRATGDEGYVLRAKTSDELKAYLDGSELAETAWLSPDRQYEEAWFLGLRLNSGVDLAELQTEFGAHRLASTAPVIESLARSGWVVVDQGRVRLTDRGRLLSNEVFEQFLGSGEEMPVESGA